VTTTPWTEGEQRFSGPKLATLAGLPGLTPVAVVVRALNVYAAEIPQSDWTSYGVILASRRNGKAMPIKEKGPFWIMYPISLHPRFGEQTYQARMVWQVKELEFIVR
jgi:hypothetical protein